MGIGARSAFDDGEHSAASGVSLYFDAGAGSASEWGGASLARSPELHRSRARSVETNNFELGFVSAVSAHDYDDEPGRFRGSASASPTGGARPSTYLTLITRTLCCYWCTRSAYHALATHDE